MTNTLDIENLKRYNNWALCFARIGEKQPIVITKKWVDKVLAVYPHYFDKDNEDYISPSDDLWLNYTATVTPSGGKSYSGDLVNTGSTINFKDGWLTYEMVDKICRNSLMLFPVNRERQLCMGFMFTQDTPFTIIDFDRKEETSSQEMILTVKRKHHHKKLLIRILGFRSLIPIQNAPYQVTAIM